MTSVEPFPPARRDAIERYLPHDAAGPNALPHLTLTYATSLDSGLALRPGTQTLLSGPESKSMTHYLRAKHDAILIGWNTARADDPSLGCRLAEFSTDAYQPRPVILDAHAKWCPRPEAAVIARASRGGRGPWIITATERSAVYTAAVREALDRVGGAIIQVGMTPTPDLPEGWLSWETILRELKARAIRSVMVEGGAGVINDLLQPANQKLINSVIITVAPVFLGEGSVTVAPGREQDAKDAVARLTDVNWTSMGKDAVLCGFLQR